MCNIAETKRFVQERKCPTPSYPGNNGSGSSNKIGCLPSPWFIFYKSIVVLHNLLSSAWRKDYTIFKDDDVLQSILEGVLQDTPMRRLHTPNAPSSVRGLLIDGVLYSIRDTTHDLELFGNFLEIEARAAFKVVPNIIIAVLACSRRLVGKKAIVV